MNTERELREELQERNLCWLDPFKTTAKRFSNPLSIGDILIRTQLHSKDCEMIGSTPKRYICIYIDEDGFQWIKGINKDGSLSKVAFCYTADYGRRYTIDSSIALMTAVYGWSIDQITKHIKEEYYG